MAKHKVIYTVRGQNNVLVDKVEKFETFVEAYKFGKRVGQNVGHNVGQAIGRPVVEKA